MRGGKLRSDRFIARASIDSDLDKLIAVCRIAAKKCARETNAPTMRPI